MSLPPVLAVVVAVVGTAAVVYGALCTLLYLTQDGLIFYPSPNDPELVRQWRAQRVEIPAGEHPIEGWWAENPSARTPAVILYFGGNAEDVLYTAGMARRFEARRLLVTSYRGYGARSGRPSEAALYEDAAAIYDHVVHRQGVAPAEIVVLGRSLGSGVATWLAAHRPVRAAVLVTPFDSLVAVAKGHYPIFPVGSLMRHRFASDERARELELPVLMIAAERDTIIPPAHASALHEVWRGPKSLQLLAGVGHNDLEAHPRYHDLINEFLDSVFRGELAAPSPVPTAWE